MGIEKIKDLPVEVRPREKALILGLDNLTDEELLAIIISSGTKGENALDIARALVKDNLTLLRLSQLSVKQLMRYRGVKQVTALKLATSFTLAKRLNNEALVALKDEVLTDEIIASKFALEMADLDREKVVLLLLNKKKNLIAKRIITLGNKENVTLDVSLILKELFVTSTYYFYLLHNHPSGSYNCSVEDIIFTHRIKDLAKKYKRYLVDHLIFTEKGCFSMGKNSYID